MLSKKKMSIFASLQVKKYRQKYGLFCVEGKKSVRELQNSGLVVNTLLCKGQIPDGMLGGLQPLEVYEHCGDAIQKISSLRQSPELIAIVTLPEASLDIKDVVGRYSLFVDDIQDPGNMGTIIRTAVWFGIRHIACSLHCADVFNPKTIQSSMGAFSSISFAYVDKMDWVSMAREHQIPIIGAFMEGVDYQTVEWPSNGILVIGNEGSGIDPVLFPWIDIRLHIPGTRQIESLNAGVAAGILMNEMYRRGI
jgi:RNA methyltransferase, TrmH family